MHAMTASQTLVESAATALATAPSTKWGLCCWDCSEEMVADFPDQANWNYDYRLFPNSDYPYDLAAQQGNEFIPMLNLPWKVQLTQVMGNFCSGVDPSVKIGNYSGKTYPQCTMEQVEAALMIGEGAADYEWLMGFNEPWTHIDGAVTATAWAQWIQPLGAKYDLKMLSPTMNVANIQWTADFFMGCVDQANAEFPCDYTTISAISIHDYVCQSSKVNQRYAPGTGQFYT